MSVPFHGDMRSESEKTAKVVVDSAPMPEGTAPQCTCDPYDGWHGYGCPLDQGLTPGQQAMVDKVSKEISEAGASQGR